MFCVLRQHPLAKLYSGAIVLGQIKIGAVKLGGQSIKLGGGGNACCSPDVELPLAPASFIYIAGPTIYFIMFVSNINVIQIEFYSISL